MFQHSAISGGKTLVYTVTEDGLTSVTLDGEPKAVGKLWFRPSDFFYFGSGVSPAPNWAAGTRTLTVSGESSAKVTHVLADLTVEWLYEFVGEDCTVTLIVTNRTGKDLTGAYVYGLAWTFADAQWRDMGGPSINIEALARRGRGLHPSFDAKSGACYGEDGIYGVGFSPLEAAYTPTALCWSYYPTHGPSAPHFYTALKPIHDGGTQRFRFQIRVSADPDWRHLLEPYKAYFHATYSSQTRYTPDFRPLAQYVAVPGSAAYTPTNPYGFQWYRFDRATDGNKGTDRFISDSIAAMAVANAQGLIIWQPGGAHFGGYTYTADFDVLPPDVDANLPAIKDAYVQGGYQFGSHSRPSQASVRRAWQPDNTWYPEALLQVQEPTTPWVDQDVPLPSRTVGDRFQRMKDRGFTLFYLDSFGHSLNDVWMAKRLRDRFPSILMACEYWTDVMFVQAAGYAQVLWDVGKSAYRLTWPGTDRVWEVAKWLLPDAQLVCKPTSRDPADPPSVWQWIKDRGMTPMFYVGSSQTMADAEDVGELW